MNPDGADVLDVDEPVTLTPHDPCWAAQGQQVADAVAGRLGALARDVQHIGSTAVPGLVAKPVLDLAAAVTSTRWPAAVELLAGLAFEDLGEAGVPGRRYLRRRRALPAANVHLLDPDGALWADNLLLRDYLRARPEAAHRYGTAKAQALHDHATLLSYSAAKAAMVQRLLAEARAEAWRR